MLNVFVRSGGSVVLAAALGDIGWIVSIRLICHNSEMERWQGKQGKEPYNYNFCWCWVDAINLNLLASKIYWIRYVFVIWLLWLFGYWRAEADTSLMKHSSSWNTWLWLISIFTQSIKIQMSHSGTVCLAWIVVNTWCEEIKRNKSKMLCTRLVWGQLDPVEKTVVDLKLELRLRRIFRQ